MPTNITVRVHSNESLERALSRFQRKVKLSGLLGELRDREEARSPGERRRAKQQRARKRAERNHQQR